jgi:hypothetical protein
MREQRWVKWESEEVEGTEEREGRGVNRADDG